MAYTLSKSQVLTEFESSEFILKTQRQIAKNLVQFSISVDPGFLSDVLSYDSILLSIEPKLAQLMQIGEQQFLQYLYLVDLPEIEFLNLLNDQGFLPKISELILKREAYKVYLRAKY